MQDAIQAAIDELKTAFPPHPLDTERNPAEWSVFNVDGNTFAKGVHGKSWDELMPRFLEFHHDALAFLGLEALVEVLPAYLTTAILRNRELDMLPTFLLGLLTRHDDGKRFDALYGRLTPAQRQAVKNAIAAWANSPEVYPRQRVEIEALANNWRSMRSGQ